MPPKAKLKPPSKKTLDTEITKQLKDLLRDYEQRVEKYETSVITSVKRSLRRGIDEDKLVTRFLVDPQDRRVVEYWDDEKFIKELSGDHEEAQVRKKKGKARSGREDKPLAKVLPLIESLRARRYSHITELLIWDCHYEHDDAVALAGLLARGCYPLQHIEMIDCFLSPKAIGAFIQPIAFAKTMRELVLDFNELGERGCRVLCAGLTKTRFLVHLSLAYCGLTKQCGLWLGNLVVETPIRELILDGNMLEAEGAIALLSQLSEAAESEGFERTEEVRRKQTAEEELKRKNRPAIDLDNPEPGEQPSPQPVSSDAPKTEPTASPPSSSVGRTGRGKKGKKAAKSGPPPLGPQISVLKLADTGIHHMGRGGNFAPVRCMQLLRSIITHSKDLQEVDLFANEIGDLGARQLLEGILARREMKLPQIGVRVGHRINQDTFDIIHKLAPGPKKKGKGKKAK